MNNQFPNAVNSTNGNNAPAKPGRPPSSRAATTTAQQPAPAAATAAQTIQHPPPKTDKPRPHVCATCTRPFARLEHLKRHERSHTKEKPFECPECTRCFARRDLLLRHQQKLHFQTTPSSRPRNGNRRESQPNLQTATAGGRVRKNSVSTTSTSQPTTVTGRPRANTIAHVDTTALGLLANSNGGNIGNDVQTRQPRVSKINTGGLGMGMGSLSNRNTMVQASSVDLDGMFFATINPASLQLYGSPLQQPLGSPTSPFGTTRFPGLDDYQINDGEDFEWLNPFNKHNTIDEGGSPSAVSTTSQSGISEVLLENNWNGALTTATSTTSMSSHYNSHANTDYSYSSYGNTPPGTVSPRSLMQASASDGLFPTPALSGLPLSPSMAHANFSPYPVYGPDPPTATRTTASVIASVVDSLCDATRNALLTTLALPSAFSAGTNGGGPRRRYSTSSASALTVNYFSNTRPAPSVALPSTDDLKRYVSAYFENFHPHMPFLHIPTLRLDSTAFTTTYKDINQRGVTGGAGCLVLAMASIGALYVQPGNVAREIFESTKKTIQVALDDRRKAEVAAAVNGINTRSDGNRHGHTPLWLVQALLLNVMFGVHCGEQQAVNVSKSHCSALVSLARSAGLMTKAADEDDSVDIKMADLGLAGFGDDEDGWPNLNHEVDEEEKWTKWVHKEERKRTLFGIHLLNTVLVACHNYTPLITNADILLDLPCHEDLWTACSSGVWRENGGAIFAEQTSLNFQGTLSALFAAGQQPMLPPPEFDGSHNLPAPTTNIVTSTWGCMALLNALHIYIWEVRHQQGNQPSDPEAMHAHIEPALKAWQGVWFNIPQNRCERNGTFIMPALAADCIPMLDIAYTRLFVDFGRVKDAFWSNDMERMADELSKSWASFHPQNASPSSNSSISFTPSDALVSPHSPASSPASTNSSPNLHPVKHEGQTLSSHFTVNPTNALNAGATRRERHLRRAACYAADSLSMSGPMFNNTDDSDWNHPVQFPFCTFDCALVLGEWIATVQERVGPCMGLLGSEECNLESLEGYMMLEDEDRTLLNKVITLLVDAENKFAMKWNSNFSAMRMGAKVPSRSGNEGGLASMVFMLGAFMLDKMMVWPVAQQMATALRSQAAHMEDRIPDNFSLHR